MARNKKQVRAHLQDAVEDSVVHVLNVALALLDSATPDEVLPADDGREEDADWNCPRHTDDRQHVLATNEQSHSLTYFRRALINSPPVGLRSIAVILS